MNGESTSMVWPTLGSRTAKEQNRNHSVTQPVAVKFELFELWMNE